MKILYFFLYSWVIFAPLDPDPDPATQLAGVPVAFSQLKRTSNTANMKILYFLLYLWVNFAFLDPDPDPATQFNADPCGSGSSWPTVEEVKLNWRVYMIRHGDGKYFSLAVSLLQHGLRSSPSNWQLKLLLIRSALRVIN
jgi:hypothetical protein